jgi:hypothetical protein
MVAQVSKTCCAADFRIGVPQAGWETRDTADVDVCATKTGMRPRGNVVLVNGGGVYILGA